MPVVAKFLDPGGIVEQREPPFPVIVFLRDQLAGGGHLLEQRAHHAVAPDTKVGAQGLKVDIAVEELRVHQLRKRQEWIALSGQLREIHRGQRRGLERLAVQATTGQREVLERQQAVFDDGRGLPHLALVPHDLQQALHLPVGGELGGNALVGVGIVG